MAAVSFLIITHSAVGASEYALEDKIRIYGGLIDEVIKKCEAKACISGSSCEAIRRDTALACMKSAYFKAYNNELAWKMNERNLKPKLYIISQFLNQTFFELVRFQSRKS